MTATYEPPAGYSTEIRCLPSYDYRDNPKDQRGASGMRLAFIVRDVTSGGTIQALISTGWMRYPLAGGFSRTDFPQRRHEHVGMDAGLRSSYPSGSSVSLHMPTQLKDWWHGPDACDLTATDTCYGDTGYTLADRVLEILVEGGDQAVWPFLIETMQAWLTPEPVPA